MTWASAYSPPSQGKPLMGTLYLEAELPVERDRRAIVHKDPKV